ncbi:hypothetical protein LPB85_20140 [Chryseobacterium sp. LC2016-27]|uniref:RHS repeat-associated core domain-containing protein n=1 Tax=Chryseobacterium sp. LC2016-27 TaxID=2897326 RepID=UPI001E2BE7E8|nr:RHS repeat-associated core domain-containing protein [Chryseobacterium sp. LC2016-27]MCD0457751.1 hypothetical protein [Chryseobacterium sp. LC2016-27]
MKKRDYDLNGNITRLQRSAELMTGNTATFKIDNLRYDHTGNRLTKVTEEEIGKSDGYPYLASHNTIEYDNNLANGNGNMTKHLDKGISSIHYNFLNLPKQITQNAQVTNYVYRADGAKVKKLFGDIETNYLDGFQYKALKPSQENPGGLIGPDDVAVMKLRIIPTSEGYFDAITNQYIYNYTDHLGNIRLSYTDTNKDAIIQPRQYFVSECDGNWNPPFEFPTCIDNWKPGEIVEVNNYYPFGLMHNYTATTQNAYQYKYQGQELQETGFYSFKWRNYMPDVGRFFNIDPLSEKYSYQSHYNFSENRVVDGRELEGLEWVRSTTLNQDGTNTHTLNADIKLVNGTRNFTSENMKDFETSYVNNMKNSYYGLLTNGDKIEIGKINFETVSSVKDGDYSITIVDTVLDYNGNPVVSKQGDDAQGMIQQIGKNMDPTNGYIGNNQQNNMQVVRGGKSTTGERAAHETGHTFGLRHQDDPSPQNTTKESVGWTNLLHGPRTGNEINPQQRDIVIQNIPEDESK